MRPNYRLALTGPGGKKKTVAVLDLTPAGEEKKKGRRKNNFTAEPLSNTLRKKGEKKGSRLMLPGRQRPRHVILRKGKRSTVRCGPQQ